MISIVSASLISSMYHIKLMLAVIELNMLPSNNVIKMWVSVRPIFSRIVRMDMIIVNLKGSKIDISKDIQRAQLSKLP